MPKSHRRTAPMIGIARLRKDRIDAASSSRPKRVCVFMVNDKTQRKLSLRAQAIADSIRIIPPGPRTDSMPPCLHIRMLGQFLPTPFGDLRGTHYEQELAREIRAVLAPLDDHYSWVRFARTEITTLMVEYSDCFPKARRFIEDHRNDTIWCCEFVVEVAKLVRMLQKRTIFGADSYVYSALHDVDAFVQEKIMIKL